MFCDGLCCVVRDSYLTSLECRGDPAWECLVSQQNHLIELLEDCKDDHIEAGQSVCVCVCVCVCGRGVGVGRVSGQSAEPPH